MVSCGEQRDSTIHIHVHEGSFDCARPRRNEGPATPYSVHFCNGWSFYAKNKFVYFLCKLKSTSLCKRNMHHWVLKNSITKYCSLKEKWKKVKVKVAQSCPTLQPHGLYSLWNSLGQNTGVGSLTLLQGIFSTQGSNPGLLHCRRILYQLSHKICFICFIK